MFINSDAWNFFFTGKDWRGYSVEQLKREIEKDVDWYADKGGVEAIFYNLNFQRCFWPTKVGTPYWKDLEVDAATNLWLRGVKLTEKDGAGEYLRMFLTAKPMWEKFPDFLKYRYAYCHKKGVEMWHSLRVNDVHHAQKGGEGRPQHGDLWRTRPDLHRAEYRTVGKHGWSDRSFDYGKDEVRAYHLGLAREYLLDYESDGMELDFMRHAPFFKPGYDEANAPLMTQFVRDVRKLCDAAEKKWGHKLRIAVRVPAYPADALGLGMDVPAWVREKLVDVVIPSPMGLETVSDTQVALWRVVCPPPVVLAPCIDYLLRIRWEARLLFDTPTDLGFASSFYNQGADTVYFYNHYPRDRDTHPDMPDAFATCGDRAAVAKRARRCVLTDGSPAGEGRYWTSRFPVWGMSQNNFCGGAKINVGDGVEGRAARVVVGASCDLAVDVYVNGEKCAKLDASAAPKPLPKLRQLVVAQIPGGVLHDGWNLVELVNRGKENLGEWRIAWCEIDVDAEAADPVRAGGADDDALCSPAYFWMWNDRLDVKTLCAQLDDMRAQGMRNVCIHPFPKAFRPGRFTSWMAPDYLTPEYMKVFAEVARHAASLGMHCYLYDEGGWPSGGACGLVARSDPERRLARRWLWVDDAGKLRESVDKYDFAGPAPYPSIVEKGTAEKFLSLTHDRYAAAVGDAFGKSIRVAFTDEPNAPAGFGWASDFAAEFQRRKGYDVTPHLVEMLKRGNYSEERVAELLIDYRDVMADLVVERYLLPVRDWCRAHKLLSGGHMDGEDNPSWEARYGHGSILRSLRAMDVPGVDAIWRQIFPPDGGKPAVAPPFPRYAASAAHQNGGRFALSETFGIYGDAMTPAQMKWLVDYQLVRGVNTFVFGYYAMTNREQWVTLFGPHGGPNAPYWTLERPYFEYVERACRELSRGRSDADVAVLYDVRGLWAGGRWTAETDAAQRKAAAALDARQVDYDFVEDRDLASAALSGDGAIAVGKARYRTVVLPTWRWLDKAAAAKLAAFERAGGRVVRGTDVTEVSRTLDVSGAGAADLRVLRRVDGGRTIYFTHNEALDARAVEIVFPGGGRVLRFDFAKDAWETVSDDGRLRCVYGPGETALYAAGAVPPAPRPRRYAGDKRVLNGPWTLRKLVSHEVGRDDFAVKPCGEPAVSAALGDWRGILGGRFSGRAVYRTTFTAAKAEAAQLDLGTVKYAASARLNGRDLGPRFFGPHRWDVELAAGTNVLEVTVANLLANQLGHDDVRDRIAREFPPASCYDRHQRPFDREHHESGLYGPVTLTGVAPAAETAGAAALNPVIPFLAITGRPTEADVAAKVAALKADGFDQFLVYARSGLQYRYMGEEWLATVEACCREGQKRGMKVWLYDEFNWPSGTCKGRVPEMDANFRYSEWALYPKPGGGYRWEIVKSPAGWVNVCEPDAIKCFIKSTHEVYEKRLAKYFAAKVIPGIFTDEPGHPMGIETGADCRIHFRRWRGMEDEYRAETGRDFRADVEAALDGKADASVWATYLRLMGRRFRASYFDPIRAWCDKMGIVLTGHLISETALEGGLVLNGDPLLALKGESLPGIDEIFSFVNWTGGRVEWEDDTEWLTFATAQHAASRVGNGGLVELYACGPNDMTGARMRQMVWTCALHGVDHYLASMQVMDHLGLVEKHGYLSPMQNGQPWHGCLAGFFEDAKRAAALARRADVVRHAAVRQPFAAGAAAAFAGKGKPAIVALLRAFDGEQLSVDFIDENEKTSLPFVFEALADGSYRETRTGTAFAGKDAADRAAEWLRGKTPEAARFYEADGKPAFGLVVREWTDGTVAALDVKNGETRKLRLRRGGRSVEVEIPMRGVLVLGPGETPPKSAPAVSSVKLDRLAYALDRDNAFRLPFATNRLARFTVKEPLKGVRLVLRTCATSYAATPYAFELDGKPIAATRPCTALPVEFQGLYAETEAIDLAPGEHVVRLVSGEDDRNYFLPAAFAAGRFAVADRTLKPLPAALKPGAVAKQELANYCGAVAYALDGVTVPEGADALRLDVGNAFARVRWNGRDLGALGWAPYEWKLPADAARTGRLEVVVYTSVWNVFGDHERGDADWDARFWVPQHDPDSAPGLHAVSFAARK